MSVDTTFLIDLQRERSAGDDDGVAHRFLKRAPEAELFLSTIALGEFAERVPKSLRAGCVPAIRWGPSSEFGDEFIEAG